MAISIWTSGCSARIDSTRARNGAHHLRVGLARHRAPVDVGLTPVGHDVGGAPPDTSAAPLTVGRPTSRCSRSGSASRQPQQEPRQRRDRVHASMGLRPVGRLPRRGRGEPGSRRARQADLQLARLPDDRRVLVRKPRSQSTRVPCRPAWSSSAARWNTSEPASGVPGSTSRRPPRPAPRRSGPSCRQRHDQASRPSSSIVPPHGSWCQVPGDPAGTTSDARSRPGSASRRRSGHDARPTGPGPHDLRRRPEAR